LPFWVCYLHIVNMTMKRPERRTDLWDFHIDQYGFVTYMNFGSCNLLAGYALETLMKCCLDQIGWAKRFETHKLRLLAQSVADPWGLSLTSQQLDFLDSMQATIEWKGRYPIPKGAQTSEGQPGLQLGGVFFESVRELWNLFFDALEQRDPVLCGAYKQQFLRDANADWIHSLSTFDMVYEISKIKIKNIGAELQTVDGHEA